jgi:uncharacterized membrane protein
MGAHAVATRRIDVSDLVVITYADAQRAEDVVGLLHRLQTLKDLDLEDVVLATTDSQGQVHLQHGQGRPHPLLSAALGHRRHYGIDDSFAQEVCAKLTPGTAAVLALVRSMTNRDLVVSEVYKYGGTLLQTSLSPEAEARLRADLDRLEAQDRPGSGQSPST